MKQFTFYLDDLEKTPSSKSQAKKLLISEGIVSTEKVEIDCITISFQYNQLTIEYHIVEA